MKLTQGAAGTGRNSGVSACGRMSGSVSVIDIWLVNQDEKLREREYPFDDVIREVKVGQLSGQFEGEIEVLGLTCNMTDVRTRRDFLSSVVHAGDFLDVSDPREVSKNAHLNHRLAKRYKRGDVSSSSCAIHLVLNERDISANGNGFTAYVVGFEFANFNSPQPKPSLPTIGHTRRSHSSSGREEKSPDGSLPNDLLREFKIGGAREAGAKFVEGLFGWLFKGMGCLVSLIVTLIGIYLTWRFLRS